MIQIFLGLSLLFISSGFALSEPSHLNRNAMAGTPAKNADSGADPYKKLFVNILAKDTGIGISKLIKPGATLQRVSDQFRFTEGPAADEKGNIFFTDQPDDKIWKYDIDGNLSVFMNKTGRSNGLYFDPLGNLVACADERGELWSITTDKKVTVLLRDFHGTRFNGPNDLWIDKKGGIYFTDPYYQRDYWKRQKPDMDGMKLYYLPKNGSQAVMADADYVMPNGIIGTPGSKWLYVSDIGADKTYRYQITGDGSLTKRQLFVAKGSDGMTLDNQGNLYISGDGVTVYDPKGRLIGHIYVPSKWVGNICFGGRDGNILFITASESIYTLQMRVKRAR